MVQVTPLRTLESSP